MQYIENYCCGSFDLNRSSPISESSCLLSNICHKYMKSFTKLIWFSYCFGVVGVEHYHYFGCIYIGNMYLMHYVNQLCINFSSGQECDSINVLKISPKAVANILGKIVYLLICIGWIPPNTCTVILASS